MLRSFGRMCHSGLQSKNSLLRLFPNRTYDIDMIYRVGKRSKVEVYCDASECMVNWLFWEIVINRKVVYLS